MLTDLDYADDIALISRQVEQAQELLSRVEEKCAKKTQVIAYNQPETPRLKTRDGSTLKVVTDFKYLGLWVDMSEKDMMMMMMIDFISPNLGNYI